MSSIVVVSYLLKFATQTHFFGLRIQLTPLPHYLQSVSSIWELEKYDFFNFFIFFPAW